MWISRIELTNFKSYQHQNFGFPKPDLGKNVVLIGGMNGYGKTTLLEALYLCLYGKDAMTHLARAGLKIDDAKGYPTFLERAFNGEAKREGRDTMIVRVVINKTQSKAIDITRKWYFRSNGSWAAEEEAIVREVKKDIPGTPRVDGRNNFHLADMLDDFLVPAHIAPFFFFDGEEVKKLADQGRVEQVKQGLEGLLGVVLLRTLAQRLHNFEMQKRLGVNNVDENKILQLSESLQNNEEQLQVLRDKEKTAYERIETLKAQRETLFERITSAGGACSDVATVKDLVEEREQLRGDLRGKQKELEEALVGRLPFHLVAKNLLGSFKLQLEAETRYFSWEADKRSLEPRRNEFESAFHEQSEPEIDPALTNEQLSAIECRIEAAWASLFYPPPDDCASEIVHSYLHETQRDEALSFLNSMSLGQQEIQENLNAQHSLSQRISELGRKISKLEGIDRDGTLTTLKEELQGVQSEMDQLVDDSRVDDRRLHALISQVKAQRAEYEREKKKLDDSSPIRALLEKSERVRMTIDKLIPALFPLKVKELAKAMTGVYRLLAHKDQVAKIEIGNDGSTTILGKSGKKISFDRSAGENQIFATALIAGLAEVSGVKAPMVVDTPLGRLDSMHRKNILDFWTKDKTRQVLLLSQDEEIDQDFFKQIKGNVSKTYLLEHIDVGDGVGRTTAIEDAYFNGSHQ
jgi:DNA sulfur modification protein DndD